MTGARAATQVERGAPRAAARRRPAFTLIELLVVAATIAILLSVLLPSLRAARAQGRSVVCAAHLAQLGHAFHMYAVDFRGRAMPLAYTDFLLVGGGAPIYWWGVNDEAGVDHTRGFIWPYLRSALRSDGVFECPDQPWGSYAPQGAAAAVTSTYGYNGYFLSPPHTPGWSASIGRRPWQNVDTLRRPQLLFVFADTLLDLEEPLPRNTALLDPPYLFASGRWTANGSATTAFRHAGRANALFADGHAEGMPPRGGRLTSPPRAIGSVGPENGPHYVPDWQEW